MDFLKNAMNGDNKQQESTEQKAQGSGGFMDTINGALGGGTKGEHKEDGLDKAVDYVQKNYLGGGDQTNESAIEQAKDEQISDGIRSAFKSATGKDFPIADKE